MTLYMQSRLTHNDSGTSEKRIHSFDTFPWSLFCFLFVLSLYACQSGLPIEEKMREAASAKRSICLPKELGLECDSVYIYANEVEGDELDRRLHTNYFRTRPDIPEEYYRLVFMKSRSVVAYFDLDSFCYMFDDLPERQSTKGCNCVAMSCEDAIFKVVYYHTAQGCNSFRFYYVGAHALPVEPGR